MAAGGSGTDPEAALSGQSSQTNRNEFPSTQEQAVFFIKFVTFPRRGCLTDSAPMTGIPTIMTQFGLIRVAAAMPRVHLADPAANAREILDMCRENNLKLTDYIYRMEENSVKEYLKKVWEAMKETLIRGLYAEGILPGGLGVERKAKILFSKRCYNESADITMNRLIAAYAYAVSEENADEHIVVTAPTCGSCGVLPSVMYYMCNDRGFPEEEILDALAVAALIGNVIRTNASISGAECGCQAEIGSACSMTAGALASLYGLNIDQIEYAAEIAMEHNLGLTCDPVKGLVQIPCIERNAVAAMRAISSVNLSRFLYKTRKISFDEVVATMYKTGKDMDEKYRETSHGGLARIYNEFSS